MLKPLQRLRIASDAQTEGILRRIVLAALLEEHGLALVEEGEVGADRAGFHESEGLGGLGHALHELDPEADVAWVVFVGGVVAEEVGTAFKGGEVRGTSGE